MCPEMILFYFIFCFVETTRFEEVDLCLWHEKPVKIFGKGVPWSNFLDCCLLVWPLVIFNWGIRYKKYLGFHFEITTITPVGEDLLSFFFSFEVSHIMR